MLIKEMDVSCLSNILNKLKRRSLRKYLGNEQAKICDNDFSHSRFDGHSHSSFEQRFSSVGLSNAPVMMFNKELVSKPKHQ